jgi:hypothetical protein
MMLFSFFLPLFIEVLRRRGFSEVNSMRTIERGRPPGRPRSVVAGRRSFATLLHFAVLTWKCHDSYP